MQDEVNLNATARGATVAEAQAAAYRLVDAVQHSEQLSADGTRKWLFRFRDPEKPNLPPVEVETVYIPEDNRGTLCISSQVGCTLTCSFCHTGTQRLVRNLTAGEIVGRHFSIFYTDDALAKDWPAEELRRARAMADIIYGDCFPVSADLVAGRDIRQTIDPGKLAALDAPVVTAGPAEAQALIAPIPADRYGAVE